jgi:hypothetical protein
VSRALQLEPIDATPKDRVTLRMAREFLSGGLGGDVMLLVAVTPGRDGTPYTTHQINTLSAADAAAVLRAVADGLIAKADAARVIAQAQGAAGRP